MSRRRALSVKQARRQQMLQRYARECQRNRLALPGQHPYVLVLDRLKAGYNVAKIFRSALAMGAGEIHLVDIGPFDPAPAKGALRKVPARFHTGFDGVYHDLRARGFEFYALTPGTPQALPAQSLPRLSAFVFGHEEHGLSFDAAAYPRIRPLSIPHCGQMQSLNVSVAASIVMYEYLRQHGT